MQNLPFSEDELLMSISFQVDHYTSFLFLQTEMIQKIAQYIKQTFLNLFIDKTNIFREKMHNLSQNAQYNACTCCFNTLHQYIKKKKKTKAISHQLRRKPILS